MWMLGRGVERPLVEFTMKALAMPAFPGGSPFASDVERALWELGYPNDAELCATSPEIAAALTFTFVEA